MTAREWYQQETGYCDEAMEGVRSRIPEIMESYAAMKVGEAAEAFKTSHKNELFSAYLTGQSDVRRTTHGLEGRSFCGWYDDNIHPHMP